MIDTQTWKRITTKPWFYPGVLLLMGFLTYNYALTSLGYYWADWEIVMFMKLNPALQFDYYAHDRPFPWTYQLIHALIGENPIGWHIVTLLIRWAATLVWVQALSLIWPRYKNHFLWLGALLLVYPGFLQQSQSATKARHIMTLLMFALSVYWMALAVRRPQWSRVYFPLSWLATFVHLFTTEYFAGYELVRPALLWILMHAQGQPTRDLLRRVVVYSLPYVAIGLFFFWARFVYFPVIFATTSRISDVQSTLGGWSQSPLGFLLSLFHRAFLDLIYGTLQVWTSAILNYEGFSFQSRVAWFAFGLGVVLTALFAWSQPAQEETTADNSRPVSLLLVGLACFVVGALPIWAIGKDISTGGWNDRFALAPMLGAGLIVLALILWLVRPAAHKWVFSFLLVFSIAAQVWVVNVYRTDWRTQRNYYWQLYWRAPALLPDTTILSLEQPSPSVTHYSDAGYAINVLYHYQTEDGSLPYWYFSRRFHFDYQPGMPIKYNLRTLTFHSNTSDAVAVLHPVGGACVRVLDGIYASDPLLAEGQEALIPVSNLARILPDDSGQPPDPDIFGAEPPRTWCYYFQKADLARQQQNWVEILRLHRQAQREGFAPAHGVEYLPFVEAYAQTGDWEKAYELLLRAQRVNSGLKKVLCTNWSRLAELPSAPAAVIQRGHESLSCSTAGP